MDKPSEATNFKIPILGLRNSGKTTFIRAVSEIEVYDRDENTDPNKHILTVNIDFGRITSVDKTLVLNLFGLFGERRFHFMLDTIIQGYGTLGFIGLIDSSHPETFSETQSIVRTFAAYAPTPHVFAANFQDHPDTWDVEALRIALQIDPSIPVVPCVATDRESVKQVLLTLMEEILKDAEG